MQQTTLFGGPGCGKTAALMEIVRTEIAAGIPPERIAFTSFTTRAVEEARTRASTECALSVKQLPLFRTLHSMAYHEIGLRQGDVMQRKHWKEVNSLLGYAASSQDDSDVIPDSRDIGAVIRHVTDLARAKCTSPEEEWHALDWTEEPAVGLHQLRHHTRSLEAYKNQNGLTDFSDMLDRYQAGEGEPIKADVAIIDEAQDLSQLQWRVVQRAFQNVERIYYAGDDDQCIYHWSGADVAAFLNLPGRRLVLGHSHRLPRSIHRFAGSIAQSITQRQEKNFTARDADGVIDRVNDLEYIDLRELQGSILLLARNNYLLARCVSLCREQGVLYQTQHGKSSVDANHLHAIITWETLRKGKPVSVSQAKLVYDNLSVGEGFIRGARTKLSALDDEQTIALADLKERFGLRAEGPWHDALTGIDLRAREYYLTCRRRGEKMLSPPRVRISTIHGAKGAEADNVVLLTDYSARTERGASLSLDAEARVWYVGVTRARHRLLLVAPQTLRHYRL